MFYIDLFSGAGGLSEGFIAEGFTPVAHVEMDTDAISTLHTRIAYHYLKSLGKLSEYSSYLQGQITRNSFYKMLPGEINNTIINEKMSDENFESICIQIDHSMQALGCKHIDILVGGPPCQTFSIISRNMRKYDNSNDQRNHLYKLYAKVLDRYKPRCFVFENVPGLVNLHDGLVYKNLISLLTDAGYIIDSELLDASDFGVLQKRKRLIVTGQRVGISSYQFNPIQSTFGSFVVNDLFSDLPKLLPGEEKNRYKKNKSNYLFLSGILEDDLPLTLHQCRFQNDTDREIYRIAAELWEKEGRRLSYPELDSKLITRTKLGTFNDKYKVVAGNLPHSHTVIAHIAKDGHYYIHPDAKQARSLSIREAARIQSFPDSYFFEGSRQKKFTQIGNAVPPVFARAIAKTMKHKLERAEDLANQCTI